MTKPIAILCSDWHLSERAPVARAAEPDWFEAQARPLREIRELAMSRGKMGAATASIPVIAAGDIFDRWNASPAVINFAIETMPTVYAVPGQHDLPNHNMAEIKRSAYWTLVEAGKVIDIGGTDVKYNIRPISVANGQVLFLFGFPWGSEPAPLDKKNWAGGLALAVIHQYVHTATTGYPGAPDEQKLSKALPGLMGYNAAVFGDNHKGFLTGGPGYGDTDTMPPIMNCGTLMRRKQDEREYRPQVGILHSDGSIERHFLDVSEDKFSDPVEVAIPTRNPFANELLQDLRELEADSLDFRVAVMRAMDSNDVSESVRKAVLVAMGE